MLRDSSALAVEMRPKQKEHRQMNRTKVASELVKLANGLLAVDGNDPEEFEIGTDLSDCCNCASKSKNARRRMRESALNYVGEIRVHLQNLDAALQEALEEIEEVEHFGREGDIPDDISKDIDSIIAEIRRTQDFVERKNILSKVRKAIR
jgi:hypothetical protein